MVFLVYIIGVLAVLSIAMMLVYGLYELFEKMFDHMLDNSNMGVTKRSNVVRLK